MTVRIARAWIRPGPKRNPSWVMIYFVTLCPLSGIFRMTVLYHFHMDGKDVFSHGSHLRSLKLGVMEDFFSRQRFTVQEVPYTEAEKRASALLDELEYGARSIAVPVLAVAD